MSTPSALKWSYVTEFSVKAVQPILFIVLARLLTPADFGIVAAAQMIVALSQVLTESGLNKAVIQRKSNVQEAASAAFWISVALATCIAVGLFIAAEPISTTFFGELRAAPVIQAAVIQIFAASMGAIQVAILQRELKFRLLFRVRFVSVVVPGMVSVPFAYSGMGYWALVLGAILGQIAQTILLWTISDWRPTLAICRKTIVEVARFGGWVTVSGLIGWMYVWGDSLVVGMNAGNQDLGMYRIGNQLAGTIFLLLLNPLTPVLYAHLSRMNDSGCDLSPIFLKVSSVLMLLTLPIAIYLFHFSEEVAILVLGNKWFGIGEIFGAMAIVHAVSWLTAMNGEYYKAMGRPWIDTYVNGGLLLVYIAVYLIAIRGGLDNFMLWRMALSGLGLLVHVYVANIVLKIEILPLFFSMARIVATTAVCIVGVVYLGAYYTGNSSSPEVAVASALLIVCALFWQERGRSYLVLKAALARRF